MPGEGAYESLLKLATFCASLSVLAGVQRGGLAPLSLFCCQFGPQAGE